MGQEIILVNCNLGGVNLLLAAKICYYMGGDLCGSGAVEIKCDF